MKRIQRFLVLAAGSGGDVAPMARIAAHIASIGIPATLMAPARYQSFVHGTGATFATLGADDVFEEVFSGSEIWTAQHGLKASWRYYGAAMKTSLAHIRATSRPEDTVLVSSSFAVGARLAEELDGFRNTTVHLSPGVIFSAVAPPVWPAFSIPPQWPRWLKVMLVRSAERWGTDPVIGGQINPALTAAGRRKEHRFFSRWIHSPRHVLYAFPDWFASPAADWPIQGEFTGFPAGAAQQAPMPASVTALAGENAGPLIVITAGTAVEGRAPWVRAAITAARNSGARVVVVEPRAPMSSKHNDTGLISVPFVPFERLLPLADLIVHHGGIGTFTQALRSGTPQLMVPTAHDQADNAARASALGIARRSTAQEMVADAGQAITAALADISARSRTRRFLEQHPMQQDGAETIARRVVAGIAN